MKTFRYKKHKVTVFDSYNGKSIYINNPKGKQIYAHKFTGSALERARLVINGKI